MNPLFEPPRESPECQTETLSGVLGRFQPISLDELAAFRLLRRTETKFLLRREQALAALAHLQEQYRVLEINGRRLTHYQTLYFDTADWQLFRQHHSGAGLRYKVRSRAYLESQLSYLEVKQKQTVSRRTVKNRLRTPGMLTGLDGQAQAFLHDCYPLDSDLLQTRLWNSFTRLTLASRRRCERLTLDFNIQFENDTAAAGLNRLVIAEFKQERLTRDSEWMQAMRGQGIRPTGFSKYCIGVTLLYPQVKSNDFKPKLLQIERLLRDERRHARYH